MTTDLRAQVALSDQELVERFVSRIRDAQLDDLVSRLAVDFDEDADGQFSLFVTAVLSRDAERVAQGQFVDLAHTLHDAARHLDLGIPWYVRIQDEDARSEDSVA